MSVYYFYLLRKTHGHCYRHIRVAEEMYKVSRLLNVSLARVAKVTELVSRDPELNYADLLYFTKSTPFEHIKVRQHSAMKSIGHDHIPYRSRFSLEFNLAT